MHRGGCLYDPLPLPSGALSLLSGPTAQREGSYYHACGASTAPKHLAAEDRGVEQWFLVAIGDDEKAKERISKSAKGGNEVVEVIGTIPATRLASWGLTDGEIRLVLPGEPITES